MLSRSFKYFGQGQGVSAYTFVDERHVLWRSLMISAADRESAYVIDGLMHNYVVKIDIHSTETHGYTEAVMDTTKPKTSRPLRLGQTRLKEKWLGSLRKRAEYSFLQNAKEKIGVF